MTEWKTIKVPEPLRKKFAEAMHIADRLNQVECDANRSEKSRHLDAFELVIEDYTINARVYFWSMITGKMGSFEKAECLLSLERDDFRCVICRKTNVNNVAGLASHHIIPKSHRALAGQICGDLHSLRNRATLCGMHHEFVTNPPDHTWKWRNLAPRFFELIAEPECARLIREHQGDG